MSFNREIECPRCHVTYSLESQRQSTFVKTSQDYNAIGGQDVEFTALAMCPKCKFCVCAFVTDHQRHPSSEASAYYQVVGWAPFTLPKLDQRLPKEFYEDLMEAATCLRVQAPNATAMMCRRIISRLAILSGADPDKTTGPQLRYLKEHQVIDDKLLRAAEGVKAFGDGGAHPPKEVSVEDAEIAYRVTERILYYVLILDQELT